MHRLYCRKQQYGGPADACDTDDIEKYALIPDEDMGEYDVYIKLRHVRDKGIGAVYADILHGAFAVKESTHRPVSHYPYCKEYDTADNIRYYVEYPLVAYEELSAEKSVIGYLTEEEKSHYEEGYFQRA